MRKEGVLIFAYVFLRTHTLAGFIDRNAEIAEIRSIQLPAKWPCTLPMPK